MNRSTRTSERIEVQPRHDVGCPDGWHESLKVLRHLQAVLREPISDAERPQALLHAALQQTASVGGAIFTVSQNGLIADVELLQHPILQVADLLNTIRQQAIAAVQQRQELVAPHANVRHLQQVSVPFKLDQTEQVVVVLTTDSTNHRLPLARFAAHCVVQNLQTLAIDASAIRQKEQLSATAALLELAERIAGQTGFMAAQRIVADELQNHLNVAMVAVGWKRADRCTCKVTAISGQATFDQQSEPMRRVQTALNEAVSRGTTLQMDLDSTDQPQGRGLRQVMQQDHASGAMSAVLRDHTDTICGALVVVGDAATCDVKSANFLDTVSRPVGTALRTVRAAEPSLVVRGIRWLRQRRPAVIVCSSVIVMAMIAVLMMPLPYRVAASFTCAAVQRHYTVAPFDGLISQTFVRPGDRVETGQLLASMDGHQLRMKFSSLLADREKAGRQRDVHFAGEQVVESIIADLEVDRLASDQQLLQDQLRQLELRSAVSGVVLAGSLDEKQNYPVETGQMLYEVARLDRIRMDVAVPEEDIDHVETGMPVRFRPDHAPQTVLKGTVERIRPQSETVGQRNVFIAEVVLPNPDGKLRPGMEGVATIEGHPHALAWNLFHKPWEYAVSRLMW